jgi:hypothetical protein
LEVGIRLQRGIRQPDYSGAPIFDEAIDQDPGVYREIVLRQKAGGQQRVVQLVGIARIGAGFFADAVDRRRVQPSEFVSSRRLARPARLHRLCPSLFERRIVQKRIRPRVDDLVRER